MTFPGIESKDQIGRGRFVVGPRNFQSMTKQQALRLIAAEDSSTLHRTVDGDSRCPVRARSPSAHPDRCV